MNKENIIDYVVQTPHNPNKKVLDDMLETLIEENGGGNTSVSEQIAEAIAKIPQNDWNQNDIAAKDYIKNRPFYEEGTIIVPKRTIDIPINATSFEIQSDISIEEGQEYTIILDGEKYISTPFIEGEGVIDSNMDYNGTTIIISSANFSFRKNLLFWTIGDVLPFTGKHTIAVALGDYNLYQIDPKYIKDMYYEEASLQHFDITDKFTFTPQASDGITMQSGAGTFTLPFVFTIGETYKFTINGTEYETICQDMTDIVGEGCLGFGDIDAMLNNDIASVNFIAYGGYNPDISNEFYMPTVIIKTESEITEFAIDGVALNIVKIDKKYLPNSIESINGITPGSDGAVTLTSSDVGAAKVIEVTEIDGKLSMTSDEIEEEEAAGNIVKIIDSKGKVYIRVGEKFANMSYNPDLFNVIITYASVSGIGNSAARVTYKEYILPNIPAYPGTENNGKVLTATNGGYLLIKPYERKFVKISKKDGVWESEKTMKEIENSVSSDLYAKITCYSLDIAPIGGDEDAYIYLKYISAEQPGPDMKVSAYIFSGAYGDYLITATIKEDGVTVDVVNTKKFAITPTDALILLSPNGTRFNITVGDDGLLSATKITE